MFVPVVTLCCQAGVVGVAMNRKSVHQPVGDRYDFLARAHDMASFLGFDGRGKLEGFFKLNPQLWGNHQADLMFNASGTHAFGKGYFETLTLLDKAEHWAKFYDRLIEAGY